MSIKQKTIKGILWSTIQGWGSQAISLMVFFILARLLTPEIFGLVALANVFLAFMQVFLNQGFAQALIQRNELEPEHLDTAFWTNLGIGIILTLLGVIFADFIANFFKQPNLTPIIRYLSLLFLITSLSNVQQALLERQFAFKAIAVRSLLGLLLGGVIGVGMAWSGFGVWSLVTQQLVYEGIGALVLWIASDWRPGFHFSIPHFQQLFSFGISLLALNFVNFFNKKANDLLVGYFLTPETLGYYSIANRVVDVVLELLVRTSNQVAFPMFSRLREDMDRFRQTFYIATQFASLLAFPTFIGMAILAPELVKVLFGEKWLPAVPVIQILTFAGIIQSVSFFKGHILVAMGKAIWRLWQSLVSIMLGFIGFAIAFRWGIIGVSVAYVIRRYLVFPLGQWQIDLLVNISWGVYLRQFIAPLISSLIMAIAILGTKQLLIQNLTPFLLIVICTIVGTIVYGIAIRLFAPQLFNQLLELAHLALSKSPNQKT